MDIGILGALLVAGVALAVGFLAKRVVDRKISGLPDPRPSRRVLSANEERASEQAKEEMERQRAEAWEEINRIPPGAGLGT